MAEKESFDLDETVVGYAGDDSNVEKDDEGDKELRSFERGYQS